MRKVIKRKDWTEEMLRDISTLTDTVFATKYGYKIGGVASFRIRNKIRKQHPRPQRLSRHRLIVWTESMLQQLGKIHDKEVAQHYGISLSAVRSKRQSMGINGIKLPQHPKHLTPRVWPENEIELFSTLRNKDIEALLNFRAHTVSLRRKHLGIELPLSKIGMTITDEILTKHRQILDSRSKKHVMAQDVISNAEAGLNKQVIADKYNMPLSRINYIVRSKNKFNVNSITDESVLEFNIDTLGLNYKLVNILRINDINTVMDLTALGKKELLNMPNMGRKSLLDIVVALEHLNLTLS